MTDGMNDRREERNEIWHIRELLSEAVRERDIYASELANVARQRDEARADDVRARATIAGVRLALERLGVDAGETLTEGIERLQAELSAARSMATDLEDRLTAADLVSQRRLETIGRQRGEKVYAADAHAEAIRIAVAEWKRIATEAETRAIGAEEAQAGLACAAMREALERLQGRPYQPAEVHGIISAALATDAGRGWLSPADRLRACQLLEDFRCAPPQGERPDPEDIDRAIIILQFDPEDRPPSVEESLDRAADAKRNERVPGPVYCERSDPHDTNGCFGAHETRRAHAAALRGATDSIVEVTDEEIREAIGDQAEFDRLAVVGRAATERALGLAASEADAREKLQIPAALLPADGCPVCGGSGPCAHKIEPWPIGETQDTINDWQRHQFGADAPQASTALRLIKECCELQQLFFGHEPPKVLDVADECADIVIFVYYLAMTCGFDLQTAVNGKMATNRRRKWASDGTGHYQHVETPLGDAIEEGGEAE